MTVPDNAIEETLFGDNVFLIRSHKWTYWHASRCSQAVQNGWISAAFGLVPALIPTPKWTWGLNVGDLDQFSDLKQDV